MESTNEVRNVAENTRILGLVIRAQSGDKNAFTLLYQEYVTVIYRYTYLRVGHTEQAEDITQEVFLRALDGIKRYRYRGKPFVNWLFRIAHNMIIDHYRQKVKNKFITLDETIDVIADDDPVAETEKSMEMEKVKQAIENLPPRQREVISLRFGSELSVAETARVIGKTEGTVKKLQYEALRKLRELMKK